MLEKYGGSKIKQSLIIKSNGVEDALQDSIAPRPVPQVNKDPATIDNLELVSINYRNANACMERCETHKTYTVHVVDRSHLQVLSRAGEEHLKLTCIVREVVSVQNRLALNLVKVEIMAHQAQ